MRHDKHTTGMGMMIDIDDCANGWEIGTSKAKLVFRHLVRIIDASPYCFFFLGCCGISDMYAVVMVTLVTVF